MTQPLPASYTKWGKLICEKDDKIVSWEKANWNLLRNQQQIFRNVWLLSHSIYQSTGQILKNNQEMAWMAERCVWFNTQNSTNLFDFIPAY